MSYWQAQGRFMVGERPLQVLDLFSGIGGFSLGLEAAGMQTVAFVEKDDYCRRVLKKHWPDVPIYNDVDTFDGKPYRGTIDVICGGFPCQPFSYAGERRGVDDDRNKWPSMFRVIREVLPAWVVCENVIGITTMALDEVLADLESAGYAVQTFDIPACGVDAPHLRHRCWIIAHARSDAIRERAKREATGRVDLRGGGNAELGDAGENVLADAAIERPQRRISPGSEPATALRLLFNRRSECIDRHDWQLEPGVGRVANGIPRRVDRLRTLGNAVVPQVVFEIGRSIDSYGQGTDADGNRGTVEKGASG